jgi:ABC transport system ATP-binding/permease protein
VVLGLDGWGEIERFADYSQWDAWQRSQSKRRGRGSASGSGGAPTASRRPLAAAGDTQDTSTKKKLSYGEAREFTTIEQRIAEEEKKLGAMRAALQDPAIVADRLRLQNTCVEMEEAQKAVDRLYARWAELEKKQV